MEGLASTTGSVQPRRQAVMGQGVLGPILTFSGRLRGSYEPTDKMSTA